MWTDASRKGFGGYYLPSCDAPIHELSPSSAFSGAWGSGCIECSITYLEMTAVLHGLKLWKEKFKDHEVVCFCDNQGVVRGLWGKNIRGEAMNPLGEIIQLCKAANIELAPRWIPGKGNVLADLLSRRCDIARVGNLAPQLSNSFPEP
jgi:ribonuclease HI